MFTVLLVEDDRQLQHIAVKYLENAGLHLIVAGSVEEAQELMQLNEIDLYLLDVMLPDGEGWRLLRGIRERSQKPVLMLTARREEEDKLMGFDLGADDYLTKPFSNKEMVARVKALLKRSYGTDDPNQLVMGILTLDTSAHVLRINDRPVELTATEHALLSFLMKNERIALSREKILIAVWGFDYEGDDRTVDTHIKRLRKKIGEASGYIQTVRGTGYKMEINDA